MTVCGRFLHNHLFGKSLGVVYDRAYRLINQERQPKNVCHGQNKTMGFIG
jgi:hypothetical protein